MKAILGVLLCYVLFSSQCFAIKGGPPYPGGTNIATTGTFAGVLQPTFDPSDPFQANSIGSFSLTLPTTGLGERHRWLFSKPGKPTPARARHDRSGQAPISTPC